MLFIREAVSCDQILGSTVEVTAEHVTLRAWLSIQKHVATTAMKPTGPTMNARAGQLHLCRLAAGRVSNGLCGYHMPQDSPVQQQQWLPMVRTAWEHHRASPFLLAALHWWSPIGTAIFSLCSSASLTGQNELDLETFRLLEIFQEFSSVFFNVQSSFVSIANTDIGDISSLPLLLGSSPPLLSWLMNHFMAYWDCRLTLFKYRCQIRMAHAF